MIAGRNAALSLLTVVVVATLLVAPGGTAQAAPSLDGGTYLGGDFLSGRVFAGTSTGITTVGQMDNLTSFGEDDHREIWAVTIDGGLYEMRAA